MIRKSLKGIALISTSQIIRYHEGKLPRQNMQDNVLCYVIRCIFNHLSPSKSLMINRSAKRAFQEDNLRSEGPGKFWSLSSDGEWERLL